MIKKVLLTTLLIINGQIAYSMESEKKIFSFEDNENIKYAGEIKNFVQSTKFFINGTNGVELTFSKFSQKGAEPESLDLQVNNNNWGNYKYLNLSVYNPATDNLWLGVKVTDKSGKSDVITEHIEYSKTSNLFLSLKEFKVDLLNIQELSFFIIRPQVFKYNGTEDVKIYLDDVNLTSTKLETQEIKVTKNIFNSRFLVESRSNMLSNWELRLFENQKKLISTQIFNNTIQPKWIINIPDNKKYTVEVQAKKDDEVILKNKELVVNNISNQNIYFGVQNSTERIDFYNPQFIYKNINFNILKGERQAFQIPFIADYDGELNLSGLNNLKHKIYRIGALQGFQPQYLFKTNNEGYIFDALEEIKNNKISFKKGELNCLYIELFNDYEKSQNLNEQLVLRFGNQIKTIDINADLYNIQLDKNFIPKNAISTYPDFVKKFYPDKFETKLNELYKTIGDEYIFPNNLYNAGLTVEEIKNIIKINPDTYSNLYCFNNATDIEKAIEKLKEPIAYIRKNNLQKNFFFFIFDEALEDQLELIKNVSARLKKEFPDIKTISTAKVFLKPEWKSQLPNIDIWVPSIKDFYTDNLKDYSWFYIFIANRPPFTNWYLNSDLVESRLIWWVAYKYNLSGFLYYTLNRWANNEVAIDSNDFPNLKWNPQSFEDANGDGEMVYAGKENILPSLRLKNYGKGVEDYILFRMLENKYGRERVLKLIEPIIKNAKDYSKDLNQLEKIKTEGIQLLINN